MAMNLKTDPSLTPLNQTIRQSPKYRHISEDLIRSLLQRELAAGRTPKEAVKAAKNKLHQIAGAYFPEKVHYPDWLAELRAAAQTGDQAALQAACLRVMDHHASTRERLPILDDFYAVTLASVQPVHSVLDVACGLNPLAIPWLPLADEATYYACDIYQDMIAFLADFFELLGLPGLARLCNVLTEVPEEQVEVALVLKVLPPLEQVDKAAGLNLLRGLKAEHLLVSFPAHSLGGRHKQMVENYERHFRRLIAGEGWQIQRFQFPTELAFLVSK